MNRTPRCIHTLESKKKKVQFAREKKPHLPAQGCEIMFCTANCLSSQYTKKKKQKTNAQKK